ncbi:MAG: ABC transporter permease subunit [Candidatus Pristimantibacillus lignocellulolyticus]|uniref:ABC transporter permease subunit n=1 Tax=Candidatus Pristimantibacillus lignocellulolyticus TaxID=2994561 RepID=A0A9J6ZKE8_9BACL|nr:MAG: ABC transporter permease subunit [Candidatus Pristimantibacillus lignocellulolyticus]
MSSQLENNVLPVQKRKSDSKLLRFLGQWQVQLMIFPGLLFIFVFNYIPMYGVLMSFQDYNIFKGFFASEWVGFKHFDAFFHSRDFVTVIRNTLVISGLKLLICFPAPIILALMLNEVNKMFFKRIVQTISYLPHFLSWVIVVGFVNSILSVDNGSLNIFLQSIGLIDQPINFLSEAEHFWTIIIGTNLWKEIGFSSIVYIAAIAGINPNLYEAAAIDGASRLKQIFLITIPSIMPVIIIFMILNIGNLLNAGFEDLLLLGSHPILRDVAEVIDTYSYKVGLMSQRYSYATAVGLFKAVISVALLTLANTLARRSGNSLW